MLILAGLLDLIILRTIKPVCLDLWQLDILRMQPSGLDYSATFGSSHALSIWCGRVLGAEEVSEVLLLSLLVLHAPSFTLSKGVTVSAISLGLMTLPKLLSQCCTRRLLRLEVIVLVWKADVVECFRRRWFYTVYRVHYLFHSVVFTLHFRLIKLLKMSLLFLVHFSFP